MKYDVDDPESYFAALPPERQEALLQLRDLLYRHLPGLKETWKYNMPHYVLGDHWFALASQKHHLSFYHCYTDLIPRYFDRLGRIDPGKGCVRFKKFGDLDLAGWEAMLTEVAEQVGK